MTIEKRASGRYRIREMRNGVYYSVMVDTEPTPKKARQLIEEKILLERDKLPVNGSFEEYANKYIESRLNVLKTPSIVKYRSLVSNMPKDFLNIKLADITPDDIQVLINEYALTHSPKSTYDLHGFIASIIGFYRPSLILRTTLPPKAKKDSYEPTDEDIKAILQRASGGRYDVIFNLLVYGLRRSEALAIDVNTDLIDRKENTTTLIINKALVLNENKEYYIRRGNKTEDSTRTIEISNALADKMIAQGYIFDGPPHMLNKALRRYQDQLGIEHFNLHKFRSYYASMMLSIGVPITFVESSGGWKHGSTALRNAYTYTQEQKLKRQQQKGVDFISKLSD